MCTAWVRVLVLAAVISFSLGCTNGLIVPGDSSLVEDVASKANDVATQVGGENGFGGALMNGFFDHMPGQMGFRTSADLAPESSGMMIRMHNESEEAGTFHLSYFVRHMGNEEQTMDVDVPAGESVTIEMPCSEIVGMGPLEMPGEAACHLESGEAVDNRMAVPGFLGEDFACEGIYECTLMQDVDDLDGDGDTEELVMMTGAMDFHMMNGGPMGHGHGSGPGMMGSHMGM